MKHHMQLILSAALLLSLSACGTLAPFGFIFTDINAPRAYRAATPAEVKSSSNDPIATGRTCSRSVLGLVAWGDHSYQKAASEALKNEERNKVLYDVKTDSENFVVLFGVYHQLCTMITGRVGAVAAAK